MAAEIQKNQITASLRQIDLIVSANGYGAAPRGTNFIALGILFVPDAANVPHYKLGTGTCVNKRRPFAYAADVVESVDTGVDALTLTAHGLETGDGPFISDEVMGAIAIGDPFYVIVDDANTYGIAETLADAYADVREALTGTETGATISGDTPGLAYRGLDGKFTYTPTQAEVNQSLNEFSVLIEGTGFENAEGGGAYSTAAVVSAAADLWSVVSGDGHTNQQKLNLAARTAAAPFTKVGDHFVYEKLDESGDSHEADVTAAGRSGVNIIDPD
jgi:hypothetical protein